MELNIGNVKLKNQVILAPMAGISNPAYMKICENMGVGLVVTELISAEAIVRSNKKTFEMLDGIENLKIPVAIQIFGSNADVLAEAAKIITKNYNPCVIDINMGCPVPKVCISSASGSALLKDPQKVYEIVSKVKESINIPVTVKIRSGWDKNSINAVEIAKICERAGASAIAIHPRTRSEGYSGHSDWNIIKEIKENVSIPVIGNGDIKSCYDAKKMLDETKCDAIMIGRAAMGNPWIIKETVEYLENNKEPQEISIEEKIAMLKYHYELLKELKPEKVALLEIRTHALWYLKGIPHASQAKNKICSSSTTAELFSILDELKRNLT